MLLEGTTSSAAIRWVREDLDEVLQAVRDNLEAYASDTSNREPLKTVQERLEELNLTFLTMQQRGASILTDEMIAVGGHMLHNGKANQDESLAALTDAIIVLPSYLDRLQSGHEDLPILLLPTLNELRATYDETLMSEGNLFAPDLDITIPELSGSEADAVADSEFGAFARRIRNQYQAALVGWLKEQSKAELLRPLEQVCRTLHTRLGRHALRRLWWIAEMTIAGFRDGAVDNDLPLRRLFARLDLTLKAMAEKGEEGPLDDALRALSRALLFQAAQARPGSKPIDSLRHRFKLEELIPDREALLRARGAVTGRDAGLFRSIGEAVREEMSLVKDSLDMELRTGRVEREQREASIASLRQLADTLNMLNLPVPARAVSELLPGLEHIDEGASHELDSPLLKLAQKLIEVESILDTHIQLLGEPVEEPASAGFTPLPAHELQMIVNHLLGECVVSLHQVQEDVRQRLAGDKNADFDTPLAAISGALRLAGQAEVAGLTEKMGRCLHAGLQAKAAGADDSEAQLNPLTDSVAALELYLSGCRDEQSSSLHFLEIMHQRLDGLPEASASGDAMEQTHVELPQRPAPRAPIVPQPAESAAGATAAQPQKAVDEATPASTIDPDMQDIFLEEFDSVTRQLQELLPAWQQDSSNAKLLTEVKRGFHTLKGSGRMVGAVEVGDFAWRIEELLNAAIENKRPADATVVATVTLAGKALFDMKARLLQQPADLDSGSIRGFAEFARQLAQGDEHELEQLHALLPQAFLQREDALQPSSSPADTAAVEAADTVASSSGDAVPETSTTATTAAEPVDAELVEAMTAEIEQYTAQLETFLKTARDETVSQDLVRAVHTLAGTLALAPLGQETELARALEHYLDAARKQQLGIPSQAHPAIQHCLHRFRQRMAILQHGNATSYPLEDQALLAEIAALATARPADQASAEDRAVQDEAAADHQPPATDTGTGSTAEDSEFLKLEEGGILGIFLEEATEVLERCDTILNTWRDKLSDQKLIQNLQREIHTFKGGARMAGLDALGDLSHAMETLLERIAANRLQATVAAVQALEEGCDRLTVWVEQLQRREMPQAGDALARFERKTKALSVLPAGKDQARPAVTAEPVEPEQSAKTGAETPVTSKPEDVTEPADAKATVEKPASKAEGAPKATVASSKPATDKDTAKDKGKDEATSQSARVARPTPPAAAPAKPAPAQIAIEQPKRVLREVPDSPAPDSREDGGSQPHIRVAAELMDSLVNFAGEISIYRARLEQQLGTVRFNLKEVEQTIGRLKEQLRKMEMETEAQMLSRYQHASANTGSSEFDPLELDRFSNMQQLSRGLSESVSDLTNLQDMLTDSVRQAETLLVQQSRVSTDLQEGLMQTRMTPFGSAAPRLRRVVRAAATETGKRARLQLKMAGTSDQLDRNVLERITAPLEHMLRNAVVHGIESPKVRSKQGKPEEGEITVTVEAEATEFVVRVQDDGNGVNLYAVRKRALERGMLKKDEDIDDKRLMEFILESGFSTSETVTGLAGRGVGMDVVNNEIKQIGGSMEIASEAGKGSLFTIRIPFSLAVMQAIGITVGDHPFLVPLNSVSGVARMLPADYTALRNSEAPHYEFAGESYPVLELEPLLGEQPLPVESENVSLLMIRSGEHKAAFRVAELQGHQEVVIKPVGPQVSSIPGILGATISADGQVVIILDMGPVIRRGLAAAADPGHIVVPAAKQQEQRPLVMVVDDSITMRKVTSRVLENHALDVMTAQDGLDAIENLHDRIPDLLLLDIEMPRMDGYELAEHVRGDPRLRHIPIVMITSRAGQKHRKKARAAGANGYLTKPYQESDLVAQVGEMLKLDLQQRRAD